MAETAGEEAVAMGMAAGLETTVGATVARASSHGTAAAAAGAAAAGAGGEGGGGADCEGDPEYCRNFYQK